MFDRGHLYTPADWYWKRDNDDLFSSARIALIAKADVAADEAYAEWVAKGNDPTPWPRDADGEQTPAVFDADPTILAQHELPGSLASYAASVRYAKETAGVTVAGVTVATDDRSKTMILGTRIKADADQTFTTPWAIGGTVVTLDAAQIVAMSNAVLDHVQACFAAYATALAAIAAGTIKTRAQVDAAFASIA